MASPGPQDSTVCHQHHGVLMWTEEDNHPPPQHLLTVLGCCESRNPHG